MKCFNITHPKYCQLFHASCWLINFLHMWWWTTRCNFVGTSLTKGVSWWDRDFRVLCNLWSKRGFRSHHLSLSSSLSCTRCINGLNIQFNDLHTQNITPHYLIAWHFTPQHISISTTITFIKYINISDHKSTLHLKKINTSLLPWPSYVIVPTILTHYMFCGICMVVEQVCRWEWKVNMKVARLWSFY